MTVLELGRSRISDLIHWVHHVAVLKENARAILYVEERTFVVCDQTAAEGQILDVDEVEQRELTIAEERTAIEETVVALADGHDLIRAVADDAVGHDQIMRFAEADTFDATAIEVAVADVDILTVVELKDATLAVALVGVAHDETVDGDVATADEAEDVGIARTDAHQHTHTSRIVALDGQVLEACKEQAITVVVISNEDLVCVLIMLFHDLIGAELWQALRIEAMELGQLIAEVNVHVNNDHTITLQGMNQLCHITDTYLILLLCCEKSRTAECQ